MNSKRLLFLTWVFAALASIPYVTQAAENAVIRLEAEDGRLSGPVVSTQRAGYMGTGYVTGFNNSGDILTLTIPNAHAGIYDVQIRYSAPSIKGYDLVVNGSTYSGMFAPTGDKFGEQDAGNVEIQNGQNTVEIRYGWGHYDIDSIELTPAQIDKLVIPPSAPVNPDATPEARALKAYLISQYAKVTLSGQHTLGDSEYVTSVTGQTPAILGSDLIEYSPSRVARGSNPNGEVEKIIAAAKSGRIVTMMWHWNAPTDLINKMETDAQGKPTDHMWYRGFYTDSTNFDLEKAIDNPGSADYNLLIQNMDVIATQLQKFQDAHIPVLWRPLHEAEGGWFWWGAKGPEPFKKLWRLEYDRFTNYHHLNNLLWVYSSGTDPNWYPGDKYVDIVGIDAYPSDVTDPESSIWIKLVREYGGRKMLALTEFGGVPDISRMRALGVRWSYFYSWTGSLGAKGMPFDSLKKIYGSPGVLNADKLPAKF
jgi:mannan endo-1,4-beta-mannosidase